MLPLIDLLAIADGMDVAGVQRHIERCVEYIVGAWPAKMPFYMDLFDIAPAVRGPRNIHPALLTLRAIRGKGFNPIPVVGLDRDAQYLRAIREVLDDGPDAICVRLQEEDYLDPGSTVTQLRDLFSNLGAAKLERHMVLDFRSIEHKRSESIRSRAVAMLEGLSRERYSRFVFLASSMISLSGVGANSIARVERREVQLWQQIRQAAAADIAYGDYGVVHPDYVDLDPRIIRPAAKIRYAAPRVWVVAKGRRWTLDTEQHRTLATRILREPEHRNTSMGWGERYLRDCAAGRQPTSNLERWVAVDTNVHFEFAVRQISRVLAGTTEASAR
jgi:hypothetical protein